MSVLVHFASRDSLGNTTFIGGIGPGNRTWQLSVADVIAAIESEEWQFITQAPDTALGKLKVREKNGKKFLISAPDGITENNLDNLPPLAPPSGGVWPQSPINFVGVLANEKYPINRARLVKESTRQMVSLIPQKTTYQKYQFDMSSLGRKHRSIFIDCNIPWPAVYELVLSSDGFSGHSLQYFSISELTIAKQRDLESNNIPYYTWQPGLTFYNNGGPSRIPEITFICHFPQSFWDQPSFHIWISYYTLNPVDIEVLKIKYSCGVSYVSFVNLGSSLSRIPSSPPKIKVPDVEDKIVATAISEINNVGLKTHLNSLSPNFPNIDNNTWKVVNQIPEAGKMIESGGLVTLNVKSPKPVEKGIKKVLFYNNYFEQRELTIWTYNQTTAIWTNEGAIAYNSSTPLEVDFNDGEEYYIFLQDRELIGCHPSNPPSEVCWYRSTGPVYGDENGLETPFTIM